MNRTITIMLTIILITLGIIIGMTLFGSLNSNKEDKTELGKENNVVVENVIDEQNISKEIKEANSDEEKISPKAFVTYKIKYEKCGHETSQYREIPEELVNLTQEELKEKYSEWNIEKFSDTNIVLSKTEKGSCNEHFILKEKNGFATVFKKLDNGEEEEYETTDIATEYLSETDKINMEKGIEVNGLQNLNQLIEDYE